MQITVTDLFDGVTPETSPITITVIEGSATTGGGGGAVDSVNGEVGVVVLDASDVGADASGAATAAVATHAGLADPHPGYLTPAEGNAAYDALGAAAAAQAASQPVDSDLTAIAALTTTSFGRALLALADAAALRSSAGLVLGTDVYSKSAVDSGFQPLDSDLTAIAALTTTSYGRAFLALADAAAARTAIGVDATGTAVLKTLYDANSLLIATTDDTPVALTVAASRIVGRKASGDIVALTAAELRAILGSGTLDSTTVLHGDGTWSAVSGASPLQAWADWTPALTATSSNPTLGSGSTQSGRWMESADKKVDAWGVVRFGTSGVAVGSGNYQISLPTTAKIPAGKSFIPVGNGQIYDPSASTRYHCLFVTDGTDGTKALMVITSTATGVVTNALPVVPAASDGYDFVLSYEGV